MSKETNNIFKYNISYHGHGDHGHMNLGDYNENSHADHSEHGHAGHSHADHSEHGHAGHSHADHSEHGHADGVGGLVTIKKGRLSRWRRNIAHILHRRQHEGHHDEHHEGDHDHHHHDESLGKEDEGCPCCANAIDLDEATAALHEIASGAQSAEGHDIHNVHVESSESYGDYLQSDQFGIFLGISGPFSLLGLTAALRNIKGSINNRHKLTIAIKGLHLDIEGYKEKLQEYEKNSGLNHSKIEDLSGVIQRLDAFESALKYSRFDANFNLSVPGIINGGASTAVLSTGFVSSPWALPIIALYAGAQAVRNGYDIHKNWNEKLPEAVRNGVKINSNIGTKKINQITDSKRKFYTANTAGFTTFSSGATMATAGTLSVAAPPVFIAGIALLTLGAISTAITNNIWTNKFKPRNADLGIDRKELNLKNIPKEIAERRQVKKVLKNFTEKFLPKERPRRLAYSLQASLPGLDKRGANNRHWVNQEKRIGKSNATIQDIADLLERVSKTKDLLDKDNSDRNLELINELENYATAADEPTVEIDNIDREPSTISSIFKQCQALGIGKGVLEIFIKNHILGSKDTHDKSIKSEESFIVLLEESDLFDIKRENGNHIVEFKAQKITENSNEQTSFLNSLQEFLLFKYVEDLRYEQYGLNDFYWTLHKKNQKNPIVQQDMNTENEGEILDLPHEHPTSLDACLSPSRENRGHLSHIKKSFQVPLEIDQNSEEAANLMEDLNNPPIQGAASRDSLLVCKLNRETGEINITKGEKEYVMSYAETDVDFKETMCIYSLPKYQDKGTKEYQDNLLVCKLNRETGEINITKGGEAQSFIAEDHIEIGVSKRPSTIVSTQGDSFAAPVKEAKYVRETNL